MSDLGTRIKELRQSRGLSQRQLADAIGVSQSALHTWEAGTRTPSIDAMVDLANYFDIFIGYFLDAKRTEANTLRLAYSGSDETLIFLNQIRKISEQLNDKGREKVIQYAADLTDNPKYQATPSDLVDGSQE